MENFIYDLNLIKGLNSIYALPIQISRYLLSEIIKYISEEENSFDISFFEDVVNLSKFKVILK